jgi:hypothetical protein
MKRSSKKKKSKRQSMPLQATHGGGMHSHTGDSSGQNRLADGSIERLRRQSDMVGGMGYMPGSNKFIMDDEEEEAEELMYEFPMWWFFFIVRPSAPRPVPNPIIWS